MHKTIIGAVCGFALTAGSLTAQPAGGLIDVGRVQVRPDKSMEFENLVKKLVEINSKKGDRWIAFSTEYGASNIVYFASRRSGYGDIEAGYGAMEAAMKQAVGAAGMAKMFADLNATSVSSVGEIRRRRWDLSVNVPASDQELTNLVAHSRWFRTIRIDVKPGRMPEFVDAWKPWQAEIARSGPKTPVLVTVTETAQPAVIATFYLKSLKEIDEAAEATQRLLSSDAYRSFARSIGDLTTHVAYELHRLRPELSNPPDDITAADPDYWRPKPAAKPKPAAEKPAEKK